MSSPHKIISFDVGIKNMAYCIFDISGGNIQIADWNTINLLASPGNEIQNHIICTSQNKNGKSCQNHAKYCSPLRDVFFCDKHAKTAAPTFYMPTKENSSTFLKKQNIGSLLGIGQKYGITSLSLKDKRAETLQKLTMYLENRVLHSLDGPKMPNSNKESLITIARNIRDKLDNVSQIREGITDVLIENQISPIASRMTTIQGLLTQYFIMRHDTISPIHIEFISSRNKLKHFDTTTKIRPDGDPGNVPEVELIENPQPRDETVHQKYKKHKKDSVAYTRELMDKFPHFKRWEFMLQTNKKDDLADCFLQGYWYITEKKLINKE